MHAPLTYLLSLFSFCSYATLLQILIDLVSITPLPLPFIVQTSLFAASRTSCLRPCNPFLRVCSCSLLIQAGMRHQEHSVFFFSCASGGRISRRREADTPPPFDFLTTLSCVYRERIADLHGAFDPGRVYACFQLYCVFFSFPFFSR